MNTSGKMVITLRLMQVGIALIPAIIGLLSLLNNITGFTDTINHVITPLITMKGHSTQVWRSLPEVFSVPMYIGMFIVESFIGVLALIGVIFMLRNICQVENFEVAKRWVYLACGWGMIVWGIGFFEIGGDWFLSWQGTDLASFQADATRYIFMLLVTFIYLKLSKDA
jgi:predicted small integral membrane protein